MTTTPQLHLAAVKARQQALAAACLGCIVSGIDYVPALLERGWAHHRRTFRFRFASVEAFVASCAAYYGPTVKALGPHWTAEPCRRARSCSPRSTASSWPRRRSTSTQSS